MEAGRGKRIVLGVVGLVVALCLVSLLILGRRHVVARRHDQELNFREEVSRFCGSQLCEGAMSKVENAMLKTADPCHDFYEYACGRWSAQDSEAKATGYLDELQRNYTSRLFRLLEGGEATQHGGLTGTSMQNFYRSCVAYMNNSQPSFLNDTLRVLGVQYGFWKGVHTVRDLVVFVGRLCMGTGLPSFVNMSTRNGILQIDLGTTLAASLAPLNVSVGEAVHFSLALLRGDEADRNINRFQQQLLAIDADIEQIRRGFDRRTPFNISRFKNSSRQLYAFYEAALASVGIEYRQMMEGAILSRGLGEIWKVAELVRSLEFRVAAFYSYILVASKMIGYELQHLRGPASLSQDSRGANGSQWNRGELNLWCVRVVENHFNGDFTEWAAAGIQAWYAVDKARQVIDSIIKRLAFVSPPSMAEEVGRMLNSTVFSFYGDPDVKRSPGRAKISTEYRHDDFLGNIVRHALSPEKDVIRWTPHYSVHGLMPTGSVRQGSKLHIVIAPVYLMEDYFYTASGEPSLNFATFGTLVTKLLLEAAEKLKMAKLLSWKQKLLECVRDNAKLFVGAGAAEDIDFNVMLSVNVAYDAEWKTKRAPKEHVARGRFFFRRFALTYCAVNVTQEERTSLNFAMHSVPDFKKMFDCKAHGFKKCFPN